MCSITLGKHGKKSEGPKRQSAGSETREFASRATFSGTPSFRKVLTGFIVFAWLVLSTSQGFAAEITIKVQVLRGLSDVKLFFASGGEAFDGRGRRIQSFRAGDRFLWNLAAETVDKKKARRNRQKSYLGQTLQFRSSRGIMEINGAKYRGNLTIIFGTAGASVINLVGLEDYVKGVVGSEIGSLSPAETLKAQAVIARTYAYANRGKHGSDGFDLCNKDHCQVYGGIKAERPTVNGAVDSTRGIIMISDGQAISSMYHSTCGGMTSNNEDVYGGKPTRYLRRVKCDFCREGTNYRWTRRIPLELLQKRLAKENIHFQRIFQVSLDAPAVLDRVNKVEIRTDRGTFSVKGTTFRRIFELPSTTFIIQNPNSTGFSETKPDSRKVAGAPSAAAVTRKDLPFGARDMIMSLRPGPIQIAVQTATGIHLAHRPPDGWKILTWGVEIKQAFPGPSSLLDGGGPGKVPLRGEENSQTQMVLLGRGYGHQVGLCQSGAVGLGKRGWSYRQILPFYYSQVVLRIIKP